MVYRTISNPIGIEALSGSPDFDVVTFASGSAVSVFAAHGVLDKARVAVIGPSTAEAAHKHGLPVHGVASARNMESLIAVAISLCDQA